MSWLKRCVLHGVTFVQLQVGEDSISLPEAWTDLATNVVGASAAIISRDAATELIRLVAVLTAETAK